MAGTSSPRRRIARVRGRPPCERPGWQNARVARTQYFTATSIDGYIADERNSLEWLFEADRDNSAAESVFSGFFGDIGAMAMGRTTYEWVVEHERLLEDPSSWRRYYGETPCWVFTHRDLPTIPGANLTFVEGDVAAVHEEMTLAAGDRNVWLADGGDPVGQFADADLLDEILLSVAPVTLGGGAPLLPRRLTSSRLELVDSVRQGQFVRLIYNVRGVASPEEEAT
jgi:dihydrofolate reductase